MTPHTDHPGAYENRTKVSDITIAEFRALVADCFAQERKRAVDAEMARLQEVGIGRQRGAESGGNAYVNPASWGGNFWG